MNRYTKEYFFLAKIFFVYSFVYKFQIIESKSIIDPIFTNPIFTQNPIFTTALQPLFLNSKLLKRNSTWSSLLHFFYAGIPLRDKGPKWVFSQNTDFVKTNFLAKFFNSVFCQNAQFPKSQVEKP